MAFFIRKNCAILFVFIARLALWITTFTRSASQRVSTAQRLSAHWSALEPYPDNAKLARRWIAPGRLALPGLCMLLSSCDGGRAPDASTSAARSTRADPGMSASAQARRHALPETSVVNNPLLPGQAGEGQNEAAALARSAPVGMAVDAAGTLYMTQRDNSVRQITPQGAVSLHAGGVGRGATQPADSLIVATDEAGNMQVVDTENCSIRRITPAGKVTTTTLPTSPVGAACSTMRVPPGVIRNAAPPQR